MLNPLQRSVIRAQMESMPAGTVLTEMSGVLHSVYKAQGGLFIHAEYDPVRRRWKVR